tara:strand:- start:22467 stop:22682 length:216 start_codon:yes stop_codon:yes gene_type:complete
MYSSMNNEEEYVYVEEECDSEEGESEECDFEDGDSLWDGKSEDDSVWDGKTNQFKSIVDMWCSFEDEDDSL